MLKIRQLPIGLQPYVIQRQTQNDAVNYNTNAPRKDAGNINHE